VWGLLGSHDIKSMHPPRTLMVTAANTMAVLIFIAAGAVQWRETLVMLIAASLGGYGGALLGKRIPAPLVRAGTLLLTAGITVAFFVRAYGRWRPAGRTGAPDRETSGRLQGLAGFLRQEAPALVAPQACIRAASGQQFRVAALFDDAAFVQDDEPIHGGDGGQAMGDRDHGLASHDPVQAFLDGRLDLGIQ